MSSGVSTMPQLQTTSLDKTATTVTKEEHLHQIETVETDWKSKLLQILVFALLITLISQILCPIFLPSLLKSSTESIIQSKFLSKFAPDWNVTRPFPTSPDIVINFPFYYVNNSLTTEDKKQLLITSLVISEKRQLDILQIIVHIPLVILPFFTILLDNLKPGRSRATTYWFCFSLLLFSNLINLIQSYCFEFNFKRFEILLLHLTGETSIPMEMRDTFNRTTQPLDYIPLIQSLSSIFLFITIALHLIVSLDKSLLQFIEHELNTFFVPLREIFFAKPKIESNFNFENTITTDALKTLQELIKKELKDEDIEEEQPEDITTTTPHVTITKEVPVLIEEKASTTTEHHPVHKTALKVAEKTTTTTDTKPFGKLLAMPKRLSNKFEDRGANQYFSKLTSKANEITSKRESGELEKEEEQEKAKSPTTIEQQENHNGNNNDLE